MEGSGGPGPFLPLKTSFWPLASPDIGKAVFLFLAFLFSIPGYRGLPPRSHGLGITGPLSTQDEGHTVPGL